VNDLGKNRRDGSARRTASARSATNWPRWPGCAWLLLDVLDSSAGPDGPRADRPAGSAPRPSTPVSGLLISCATPAPSEPMAASERERNKRSWASRSSVVLSSTRFSRVTFQPRIFFVAQQDLAARRRERAGHGVERFGQFTQFVVGCHLDLGVQTSPGRWLRAPCTSVPTRLASERASAAPTNGGDEGRHTHPVDGGPAEPPPAGRSADRPSARLPHPGQK